MKGNFLIHIFLQSSIMAGHYCPDGSIRHYCHSKPKIGLFLFAVYMYNHQRDGFPNSINIPNIKAASTSSKLSFSHCFQFCTAPPRSSMWRFKMHYFNVYICHVNAPLNLEETRVVWFSFFACPKSVGQFMSADLLNEYDRCTFGVHKTRSGGSSVLAHNYTSPFSQISRQEVSVYVGPKNKIGESHTYSHHHP